MIRTGRVVRTSLATACMLLLIALQSAQLVTGNATAPAPATSASAASTTVQFPVTTQISTAKIVVPTTASTTTTTTTTTTTITTKSPTTTAQQKPKRMCKFPFWHRSNWHHECLPYGSKGDHWCSVTRNFTRDEEWMDCARYDLLRYKCAVPFHHQGQAHSQCQPLLLEPLARRAFWCALVPSIASVSWANLGADWTFCEAANATGTDYLRAVGGFRNQADAEFHNAMVKAAAAAASIHASNNNTVAAVASAHAQGVDASKSVGASAAGDSSGSVGDGASTATAAPSSVLGVALGIVGVILAAVAVAAAFAVHRRYFRNQYKRIDPLLSAEPATEKSSYGGMQAYHD